jgi:hypothetical protein
MLIAANAGLAMVAASCVPTDTDKLTVFKMLHLAATADYSPYSFMPKNQRPRNLTQATRQNGEVRMAKATILNRNIDIMRA